MWISPNHPNPPRADQPAPPAESGQRLATFPRGQGTELRVTLDTYEGRPYLSLRIWEQGQGGAWWPTKRGVTIRLRELPELLEALRQVEAQAPAAGQGTPSGSGKFAPTGAGGPMPDQRPRFIDRRRRPEPVDPQRIPPRPAPSAEGEAFDEFQ